ncbi:hypothetical protein Bbelb_003760 [Branchiostoma belcheri]|nr:hypothetical protein Bbelb_003760 [Branchiostoma belcheri]
MRPHTDKSRCLLPTGHNEVSKAPNHVIIWSQMFLPKTTTFDQGHKPQDLWEVKKSESGLRSFRHFLLPFSCNLRPKEHLRGEGPANIRNSPPGFTSENLRQKPSGWRVDRTTIPSKDHPFCWGQT